MRRIKIKLNPSLEQDDITKRLEDALDAEKDRVVTADAELKTPLNNKQGFDKDESAIIEQESTVGEDDVVITDESTPEVDEVDVVDVVEDTVTPPEEITDVDASVDTDTDLDVVTDTTTALVDDVPVDESSVDEDRDSTIDTISDVVVDSTTQDETTSVVTEFADKIKSSFDTAKDNGFVGEFEDYLKSLTESISDKESSANTNALGTTDGAGDLIDPVSKATELDESDNEVVVDEVDSTDEAVDDVADDSTDDEVSTPTESDETDTEDTVVADTDDVVDEEKEDVSSDQDSTDEVVSDDTGDVDDKVDADVDVDTDTDEDTDTNLNGEPVDDSDVADDEVEDEGAVEEPESTDDEGLNEYISEINDDKDDEDDAMVEEAVDVSTRLGRIAEIVKTAMDEAKEGDEGDANDSLAKIAQVATESLAEKVGIETVNSTTVSMESFSDSSAVMYKYSVSLESAKEVIKKILDAIMKMIEAAGRYMADQYRNAMLAFGHYDRKIKKLEALVKNMKEGGPEKTTIEASRIVSVLGTAGAMPGDLTAGLVQVGNTGAMVYGKMTDWYLKQVSHSLERSKEALKAGKPTIFEIAAPDLSNLGLSKVDDPVKEGFINNQQDGRIAVAKGAEHLGGKTIVCYIPIPEKESRTINISKSLGIDNESISYNSNKIGIYLEDFIPNDTTVSQGQTEIKTLSKSEIEQVIESLRLILDNIKGYKQVKGKVDQVRNKARFTSMALDAIRKTSILSDSKLVRIAGQYRMVIRSIDNPLTTYTNYLLRIMAASFSYIDKSIAAHGVEVKVENTDVTPELITA